MIGLIGKAFTILFIILLVPTALVLISQDSVPGDSTYPIKKYLENIIITAASVNPGTKSYFNIDFAKRRYKEASIVVKRGNNNTQSLKDLVTQTESAAKSINQISDPALKEQYKQDLKKQIADYKSGLLDLQNDWEKNQKTSPDQNPTPLPTVTPTPTADVTPAPTANPTPTPFPVVTLRPAPVLPTPTPTADVTPAPTANPTPTPTCTVTDPKDAAGCLDSIINQVLSSQSANEITTATPTPSPVVVPAAMARASRAAAASKDASTSATPAPTPSPTPTDLFSPEGLVLYPNGVGQSCKVFTGWACDADNPDTGIEVDFWDFESSAPVFLGFDIAKKDLFDSPALQTQCGHPGRKINHGFGVNIPASLKDNNPHKVRAFAEDISSDGVKINDDTKRTLLDTIPADPNKEIQITCAP